MDSRMLWVFVVAVLVFAASADTIDAIVTDSIGNTTNTDLHIVFYLVVPALAFGILTMWWRTRDIPYGYEGGL